MPTPASALEDSVPPPATKSLEILEEAADTLRRYPNLSVSIVGFTDNRECVGAASCIQLSRRRARMVYEWLIVHGALSSQFTSVNGLGDDPVDSNEDEHGRQRNRHVEIRTQFDRQ
jgi:OOP family OmpA-OmpF porin